MIARLLGAVALLMAAAMPIAGANTITVNTLSDGTGGPNCTLRDAIVAANVNSAVGGCAAGSPGADTIVFSLNASCNVVQCGVALTSALPTVMQDLTIDGGAKHPFISGENLNRVLDIGAVTVTVSNLTITKGKITGIEYGAGIRTNGTTLTLSNVDFRGNHASIGGGGIFVDAGTLVANNCTFDGNSADFGGAVDQAGGSVTLNGCSFTNNSATYGGGAIAEIGTANLTITGSVFVANGPTDMSGTGGALYIQDTLSQATIASTTFTNNYAYGGFSGGAIYTGGKTAADGEHDHRQYGIRRWRRIAHFRQLDHARQCHAQREFHAGLGRRYPYV